MKFESIEFKNIFAYGENVNKIDYYSDEGKLILLKGQSGAGKSAILSLPILVLYGKLTKVTKSGIANRINKHGWVRGIITKGQHRYTIEREFSPNSVRVWKDDVEIECPGSAQAEAYIENEIQEIPINTFTNMITISMKKFKSFLSMSPTERKQVVDEVFDVRIINMVAEQIKKDLKELGNSINGDNSTMYTLNQTLTNANNELLKIQEKNATPDALEKIEKNNSEIAEMNQKLNNFSENMKIIANSQTTLNQEYTTKQQEIYGLQQKMRVVDEKIRLFSQSKCPTCATPFTGPAIDELKTKLTEAKQTIADNLNAANSVISELNDKASKLSDAYQKVNDAMMKLRLEINNKQNENLLINEKMKASSEYQAVSNIISKTSEQIESIKKTIEDKQSKYRDLQKLQLVYSIDGVTKLVINNYLPLLNNDIAENLLLLNFPYTLTFDDKFNPHIKDMGTDVPVETLSDGEQTRVDIVVLCSLFKLLKKKYPSINILTIDESISTIDPMNSSALLSMLTDFANENNLNCFIVSHTELFMDNFNEMIEVEKVNRFSQLTKTVF